MVVYANFSEKIVENIIDSFDFSKCSIAKYDSNPSSMFFDTTNQVYKLKLDSSSSPIIPLGNKDNIYFIVDGYKDEILYIGKSLPNKMPSRLIQHLLKNETKSGTMGKTKSKIAKIYSNLDNLRTSKRGLQIRYFTLQVDPQRLYGATEGHLIYYAKDIKKMKIWNEKY